MTNREDNLIQRLAFIKANDGKCPATCDCPGDCLEAEYTCYDDMFACWVKHYEDTADYEFVSTLTAEIHQDCKDCLRKNTAACKDCGWQKEMYNDGKN